MAAESLDGATGETTEVGSLVTGAGPTRDAAPAPLAPCGSVPLPVDEAPAAEDPPEVDKPPDADAPPDTDGRRADGGGEPSSDGAESRLGGGGGGSGGGGSVGVVQRGGESSNALS